MCSVRWFSPENTISHLFPPPPLTETLTLLAFVVDFQQCKPIYVLWLTERSTLQTSSFLRTFVESEVCVCIVWVFLGLLPATIQQRLPSDLQALPFLSLPLVHAESNNNKKKPKRNNKYCTNSLHEETFAQDSRRWLLLLYMFVLHFGSRCLLFLLNIAAAHHSLCHCVWCVCVCLSHWEHRMQSAASVIACIPPKRIHQKQRQATPQDHSLDISCKKTNRTTTKMKTGKKKHSGKAIRWNSSTNDNSSSMQRRLPHKINLALLCCCCCCSRCYRCIFFSPVEHRCFV